MVEYDITVTTPYPQSSMLNATSLVCVARVSFVLSIRPNTGRLAKIELWGGRSDSKGLNNSSSRQLIGRGLFLIVKALCRNIPCPVAAPNRPEPAREVVEDRHRGIVLLRISDDEEGTRFCRIRDV